MKKRLFLFAGFDPKGGLVDDSLLVYVRALSKLGDVAFFMDNDTPKSQLEKLNPYTVFAGAQKHGEYNFGSYKRAYLWARGSLKDYDFVYMVNDSVYLTGKIDLDLLEKGGADAFAYAFKQSKRNPHLQSWFIGMRPDVFLSKQFDDFMGGVTKLDNKVEVTLLYESGFTKMLCENGWRYSAPFNLRGHEVYNNVKKLFLRGLPFMKKTVFSRRHGALGAQVLYVLNHTKMKNSILVNARRVYGEKYVDWFLTENPLGILARNLGHAFVKVFKEGI